MIGWEASGRSFGFNVYAVRIFFELKKNARKYWTGTEFRGNWKEGEEWWISKTKMQKVFCGQLRPKQNYLGPKGSVVLISNSVRGLRIIEQFIYVNWFESLQSVETIAVSSSFNWNSGRVYVCRNFLFAQINYTFKFLW